MFRRTGCARSFRGFPDELAESSLLLAGATRHKEVSGLQCLWAEWLALHRLVVQPKPRSEAAPARVDLRQPKVTIPEEEELSWGVDQRKSGDGIGERELLFRRRVSLRFWAKINKVALS